MAIVLGDVEEAWNGAVELIVDFDGERFDFADSFLGFVLGIWLWGMRRLLVLVN